MTFLVLPDLVEVVSAGFASVLMGLFFSSQKMMGKNIYSLIHKQEKQEKFLKCFQEENNKYLKWKLKNKNQPAMRIFSFCPGIIFPSGSMLFHCLI